MTSETPVSEISFSSLHLPESLARGIADAGFERCTPIQAGTLPRALAGLDVAGQAQTGTGKTAAFLVAMFSQLLKKPPAADRPISSPRGFILAPTRELAIQIHKDAELLGQYCGLNIGLAFGGVDYERQRLQLAAGVDILIGTPGRIIDFFKQRVFDLRHVEVLVLDEADRMFDLGFIDDIRYLMRRLPAPAERLSMLFSATLSQRVLELAYEHMNDPELIRIEPEKMTADRVRQTIYFPAMEEKTGLLVGLLKKFGATRTMVFVNMKRTAERLEATLRANDINAEAMSGDVPQNKRMRMLRDFHEGKLPVLIATDVAARGLHVPEVSHVFNYDLPQDPEDYVHRIGRTGRAGAAGDAISFGCEDYVQSLPDIEAYIGRKLPVERVEPELVAEIIPAKSSEYHRGGPQGRAGGRPRPGGRRDGGPSRPSRGPSRQDRQTPHPAPSAPLAPAAPAMPAPTVAAVPIPAGDVPAKKRRRRKRGRGGAGRSQAPAMMSTPTGSAAPIKPWWIGGAIVLALIAAGLFWFALRR